MMHSEESRVQTSRGIPFSVTVAISRGTRAFHSPAENSLHLNEGPGVKEWNAGLLLLQSTRAAKESEGEKGSKGDEFQETDSSLPVHKPSEMSVAIIAK